MSVNYSERIPNNVGLSENRRLQRALEAWQPNYMRWWQELGPEGALDYDVYLRTAISVETDGWANFGYVKMPDYRWGIFLAKPEEGRTIAFGEHRGEPAWQEVPGVPQSLAPADRHPRRYRARLRRAATASRAHLPVAL